MRKQKLIEIFDELKTVMSGKNHMLDILLPALVFLFVNTLWEQKIALWAALVAGAVVFVFRLLKKESVLSALGGIGGLTIAILLTLFIKNASAFFLPGILGGALTAVLAFLSVLVKRPLVAWTSFIARRWPLVWYWHEQVRPAYSEVTFIWGLYFSGKTALQVFIFNQGEALELGVFQLLSGWPATILLLIASYLYGVWRLQNLKGPSVQEFKDKTPPPWEGQRRGF